MERQRNPGDGNRTVRFLDSTSFHPGYVFDLNRYSDRFATRPVTYMVSSTDPAKA